MTPVPGDVPIDLGPDQARELARGELADPLYRQFEPSLIERILRWVSERLDDLLALASARSLGGVAGLLVLVVLAVVVAVVVRRRVGAVARAARVGAPGPLSPTLDAADHRRAAAEHAAAGRHDDAVREWMRAIVRGLEERDLLAPRTGRTAGEAAAEVAVVVPSLGATMRGAARRFDETVYGGRPADAGAAEEMRAAEERVRAARPVAA